MRMKENKFCRLVSPEDGSSLRMTDGILQASSTGKRYSIKNDIADIIDPDLADENLIHEMNIFENLPIEGVCYFRSILMREVVSLLARLMPDWKEDISCIEIGGID